MQEHSDDRVDAQNDQKTDGSGEGEQAQEAEGGVTPEADAAGPDAAAGSAGTGSAGTGSAGTGSAGVEGLTEQLESAQAEIAALKDQALRGQAEAENIRRRAARDVENAHKFALEKFAAELLPVIDSLEKAVETAQAANDTDDAAGTAIGEGLGLSLKLFQDVLGRAGITQINPVGEPFDPKLHEAMAMVENPDAEPNSVLEVMQRGYLLNDRLVRAAMVVVSKAPTG